MEKMAGFNIRDGENQLRFLSSQDYSFTVGINQELLNTFIDTPVLLFKISPAQSGKNVYGEAAKKRFYPGVQIPCLIDRALSTPTQDVETVNIEQESQFYFLRPECQLRNIYPQTGDFIFYNSIYFEIDNINEIQLVASQTIYNHAIFASAHMTRFTTLQLDNLIV